MVKVTFKLRYDNFPKMLIEISREFDVPAVPREGESVFWGQENGDGDWLHAENVWHHPVKGTVAVEFHCELWILLEAWKSVDGWKVTEGGQSVKEKFFRYLEHPEELEEE